jgi:hypothetical protein
MRFLRAIAILLVLSACVGASDTVTADKTPSGPHGTITIEIDPIPAPAFAPGDIKPEPECSLMGGGDCVKRVLLKA